MAYDILTWLLAAFFLVGAIINAAGPGPIRRDYERWGYPTGFRFVTALLEAATAVLLLLPSWRAFGSALGFVVMAAAAATTLYHREPKRAIAPSIVLALTAVLGWSIVSGA